MQGMGNDDCKIGFPFVFENIFVSDPPEVKCQTDQVSGGGGANVNLGCFVHGEPSPSVNWFK